MGSPVVGEGCSRITIGEEGTPHGVVTGMDATCVKSGSAARPVPPITPMRTFPAVSGQSREMCMASKHIEGSIGYVPYHCKSLAKPPCFSSEQLGTKKSLPTTEIFRQTLLKGFLAYVKIEDVCF